MSLGLAEEFGREGKTAFVVVKRVRPRDFREQVLVQVVQLALQVFSLFGLFKMSKFSCCLLQTWFSLLLFRGG